MTLNLFQLLSQETNIFALLERYTCVLYDKTTNLEKFNDLRKDLFSQKCLSMENTPTTQAALIQHSNSAVYQASIWSKGLQAIQSVLSPEKYGWTKLDDSWTPLWTLLPEAAKVCRELLNVTAKLSLSAECRCQDAGLPCTALCQCAGACE